MLFPPSSHASAVQSMGALCPEEDLDACVALLPEDGELARLLDFELPMEEAELHVERFMQI